MSEVVFRGYRVGDVEAMFALDVACFEVAFRFTRADMRRFAEARKARVVVAESGGALVGFGILHLERGGVGYVVTLDVAEPWRRAGVARLVLSRLEAECDEVVLHVFVGNGGAISFYERCGYAVDGLEAGFYGDGLDALVYRKRLRG